MVEVVLVVAVVIEVTLTVIMVMTMLIMRIMLTVLMMMIMRMVEAMVMIVLMIVEVLVLMMVVGIRLPGQKLTPRAARTVGVWEGHEHHRFQTLPCTPQNSAGDYLIEMNTLSHRRCGATVLLFIMICSGGRDCGSGRVGGNDGGEDDSEDDDDDDDDDDGDCCLGGTGSRNNNDGDENDDDDDDGDCCAGGTNSSNNNDGDDADDADDRDCCLGSTNSNNDNNNNYNNCIQKGNSRFFFTISSLRSELSPTRMLKWHWRNRVQITCNISSACHVQHVVLRATWYEGTAQLLSLTELK